jgi:hypothetical protein
MHSALPTAADGASLSTSDATSVANVFPVGQTFDVEWDNLDWAVTPSGRRPGYRRLPHHPTAVGEAAS